jgi:hypothetical protein
MPKWLAPWFFPAALLVVVVLGVLASNVGTVASIAICVLLTAMIYGILIWGRLRYLKENPPDPELTHSPFWRF